jgi:hypothetical protein
MNGNNFGFPFNFEPKYDLDRNYLTCISLFKPGDIVTVERSITEATEDLVGASGILTETFSGVCLVRLFGSNRVIVFHNSELRFYNEARI